MVSKLFNGIILVYALRMYSVHCHSDTNASLNGTSAIRHKRILNLYFPHNSCYALAVVLSLPLNDLPEDRSVFVAYNFEANFYYPYFTTAHGAVPSPFHWIAEPGVNEGRKHWIDLPPASERLSEINGSIDEKSITGTVDEDLEKEMDEKFLKENVQLEHSSKYTAKHRQHEVRVNKEKSKSPDRAAKNKVKKTKKKSSRSLLENYFMSRRRFYKFMESNLDRSGLEGNGCLLKAICETAQTTFGANNGVIGSIMDVLFLPSASKDEKLPKRYYQAENNGRSGTCSSYDEKCPMGIFDFISKIM